MSIRTSGVSNKLAMIAILWMQLLSKQLLDGDRQGSLGTNCGVAEMGAEALGKQVTKHEQELRRMRTNLEDDIKQQHEAPACLAPSQSISSLLPKVTSYIGSLLTDGCQARSYNQRYLLTAVGLTFTVEFAFSAPSCCQPVMLPLPCCQHGALLS